MPSARASSSDCAPPCVMLAWAMVWPAFFSAATAPAAILSASSALPLWCGPTPRIVMLQLPMGSLLDDAVSVDRDRAARRRRLHREAVVVRRRADELGAGRGLPDGGRLRVQRDVEQ